MMVREERPVGYWIQMQIKCSASFKRFHFRLLAHLTLKWQPILKCMMYWFGSLWGPFRATVVVHLYWRVVPFWYEDTHGAETDAGGMRTALSTSRNTDCKDNGGAGRRTWSCNMPPRVEKTEPRLLSESFCYDSDMFEWCPKHLTALSKRMQVYRQDMAGQQASTRPAQNLPKLSSHGRRFRVRCRRNGWGQSLARETHCLQCKSSHWDKASIYKRTQDIILCMFCQIWQRLGFGRRGTCPWQDVDSKILLDTKTKVIKANSERALLQQFQRDWDEAMGESIPWKIFWASCRFASSSKHCGCSGCRTLLSFPTLPTVYGTFAPTAIRFKVDKLVKIGAIETKYCPNWWVVKLMFNTQHYYRSPIRPIGILWMSIIYQQVDCLRHLPMRTESAPPNLRFVVSWRVGATGPSKLSVTNTLLWKNKHQSFLPFLDFISWTARSCRIFGTSWAIMKYLSLVFTWFHSFNTLSYSFCDSSSGRNTLLKSFL